MKRDASLPRAVFEKKWKQVDALLKSGVHLESLDESGQTALAYAAMKGNLALVTKLIALGAKVNHSSPRWKDGPIHFASKHGFPRIVSALLEAGAQVDAKGFGDFSPLHYGVSGNHVAVVRVLLDAGANPKLKNTLKKTPGEYATARVAKLLDEHGERKKSHR
ncbi:MAG: hypothetical protein GQE15_16560 [Archangiaceae bacterium]|nr:hypothetical protein [Archangiaceae bacterium]